MAAPVGHPLWELTKTRLREFLRERGALFWVFGFPLLMAIGLGLAFRDRPLSPPLVAVVAADSSRDARALLQSPRVRAESKSLQAAKRELARGKIDLIFEQTSEGERVLRFDPSQEKAQAAKLVVTDVLQRAAGRRDPLTISEQPVTEPGSRYIDFLVPGLIGLNLMGTSMWGVGYSLVVARKRRLLRRYAVTPMRRGHFLLSYVLSRGIFLVLEVTVLVGFGNLVFGTVVRGNYVTLGAVAAFGAASFAGLSLLVGSRADNTEVGNGLMNFVQLPMWILSGAFFSYERFPEWLHTPIRLLPLTALNDALRAVYHEGASLLGCASELLVLSGWGLFGFALALRVFRWQ